MKNRCFVFLMIILFSCKVNPKQRALSQEQEILHQNLDNYFNALTKLKKFNGVILAYKNHSLIIEKAYNINSSKDSSTYVTVKHQFDIHSISKLMAKYLVVKLQNEGTILKHQTIDEFLPSFPNGDIITLEMLLNHTSGLPRNQTDFKGVEINLNAEDIIELAKHQQLLFEPGKDVQYSNIGYEVVYYILSKIYKKPFAQCIQDEIFIPLKMQHSGAHYHTTTNSLQNLAKNHILKDSIIVNVPNILENEFKTARIFSTAQDLNIFLKHLELKPFKTPLKNKEEIISKDGGSDGIRAQIYTDIENKFRFVLLANYDEIPFFKTINNFVKILNLEPVEIPKEINRIGVLLEKEILNMYSGSYQFADFNGLILTLKVENKQLAVFQDNKNIGVLTAESETVFFEDPKASESFSFIKNQYGTFDVLMGWKGITIKGVKLN